MHKTYRPAAYGVRSNPLPSVELDDADELCGVLSNECSSGDVASTTSSSAALVR